MSFELKLKRLAHRNWVEVLPEWMPHVGQLSFEHPGQKPVDALSDFIALREVAAQIKDDGEYRSDEPGLRAALLHEGIYLLHKASNVLVASHDQVYGGLASWSIATAYQSAFFSMEAMLMMLGVAVVEVNNKTLVLDVWPEIQKPANKKAVQLYKLGSEIQYIQHKRIEHYHRWAILKRVLRTLDNAPIDGSFINAINDIDDKAFAKQRNSLNYSNQWPFDDLHGYYSPIQYCRFQNAPSLIERLDPDHQDFSVTLATSLFSNAASLLNSLASSSALISDELSLLYEGCDMNRLKLRNDFELSSSTSLI